ncbi:MAG: ribonuclease HII [Anaerolineales bacterium]|nr:ribonuclease HII [Anaerolineales bacterium]
MNPKRVERYRPDLTYEFQLRDSGTRTIAGLDEAGRGAWAGPVVASAIVLPIDRFDLANYLGEVRDSKVLNPAQRAALASRITEITPYIGLGIASPQEVDAIGIIPATRLAMKRAINELNIKPQHLLIDHIKLPEIPIAQTAITKGDGSVLSIAAASIIAKVTRDRLMIRLEKEIPGYGFSRHKGYGTRQHRTALDQLGPSVAHRVTYAPVAACLSKTT